MDLYTSALVLGALGLALMAIGGLGRHLRAGAGGHHGISHGHGGRIHVARGGQSRFSPATFLEPRLLFSLLVGFGATGLLLRAWLSGVALVVLAVVGGAIFEILAAGPVWRFFFRFASRPASTLETTLYDQAYAVTSFDADGHGLVSVELDGQLVQVLATLVASDRAAGVRVRSGDPVRIESVDASRNRCSVSAIGR
ncbi:MAG TPA: hypothetical protein VMG41_03085 [Gemmatimonadales bacterium]|nr:hypothetical protein [Gemmatimonadales bacterium]